MTGSGLGILKRMDFPLWEEKLERGPGIEEKGSRICVESMGNRKCLSRASKTHKELPGGLELPPGTELEGPLCRTLSAPLSPQAQHLAKVNNPWAPGNGTCLRRALRGGAVLGENSDPQAGQDGESKATPASSAPANPPGKAAPVQVPAPYASVRASGCARVGWTLTGNSRRTTSVLK